MLRRMKNGAVYPVIKPGYKETLDNLKLRLEKNGYLDMVINYLKDEIDNENEFSCGTKWPNTNLKAWKGPLSEVFNAAGRDVKIAGYFLGLLVMEIIIESDDRWLGTTTNINKREFETMFYWRDAR